MVCIITVFSNVTDNQKKLIGTMFTLGLVVLANDQWVYLFGLVIIGTLITGSELMVKIIEAIKTSKIVNRNENIEEKTLNIGGSELGIKNISKIYEGYK